MHGWTAFSVGGSSPSDAGPELEPALRTQTEPAPPALEQIAPEDATVPSVVGSAAEAYGTKPFIVDGSGRTLTFAENCRRARQFANALLDNGIGRGSVVGVFSPNSFDFVTAAYGTLASGAVFTPFNSSYKERELIHQILNSGASVVLAERSLMPRLLACRGRIQNCRLIELQPGFWESAPDSDPGVEFDRERDIVFLPYSSGTTGFSKGIELTQANLVAAIRQLLFSRHSLLESEGRCYVFLPLYHIYGFNVVMNLLLAAGSTIHLRARFDMDDCLDTIERERITSLPLVPPVLLGMLSREDLPKRDFSSMQWVSIGAAPVPVPAVHRFVDITGVTVRQGYGMTETSGIATTNPADAPWDVAETAGLPVRDLDVAVFDPDSGDRRLPAGETGELALRGPNIMLGYHDAPEENARALRNGWFYTGDIGHIDSLGRVHIVDRKREMIKYRGFQVLPAELESVILELPEVRDVAVIGVRDTHGAESPKAYVSLHPNRALEAKAVQEYVRSQVAGYKQVREVEFVDSIPRSPAGKILRRLLHAGERPSRS